MKTYVCPVCGNVIHSIGEGLFHCCGISLPKLEAEADCGDIKVQNIDGELFVSLVHEMINNEATLGLASLCIGGGMGTAIILKKC